MNSVALLTNQAIQSASSGNWQEACRLNQEVVDQEPTNTQALNRLAFCHFQLGKTKEAKRLYESVLEIERFNPIATKYLSLIKQKVQPKPIGTVSMTGFIEEPGKTKSVTLVRLADPDILQAVAVATPCVLVVKNHRVNISTQDGVYLGALPDDLAFRLQRQIAGGSTYSVIVQSTSKKHCTVFIKELTRGATSPFATSFPLGNTSRVPIVGEEVLLDESPLDTGEGGDESDGGDASEEEMQNDD